MGFLPSLAFLFLLTLLPLSFATSSSFNHQLLTRSTTTCPPSSIVSVYYPSWTASQTPAQIPWASTDLAFYFSIATSPTGIVLPAGSEVALVQSFVKAAHTAKKKALFTVGGWTASVYFSQLVATATARTAFAKTLYNFTTSYGFDGVDLDWEFVGRQGAGSNIVSSADSTNLLSFLAVLRSTMGAKKLLHASVPTSGFTGPTGTTITNYKPYATYLDYITVMAYDMYASSWSATTGPNAALAQCSSASGSVAASVAFWLNSGFPACKILLGVPGYSHLFQTSSNQIKTTTFGKSKTTAFQPLSSSQPADLDYTFTQLVSMGWLSKNGTAGVGGFIRYWDSCTSTPLLFNPTTQYFIAYDDAQSTNLKAQFAKKNGLAGVNFYDSTGPSSVMYAAARSGLKGSSSWKRDGLANVVKKGEGHDEDSLRVEGLSERSV
ncbi:chitinase, partial [Phenoliferia sp. Uapishka_3]